MAGCKKTRGDKPKVKSKRASVKRFNVTAGGLVKFGAKGVRHCLSNKGRKRKRQLHKSQYLSASDMKLVRRLLPY